MKREGTFREHLNDPSLISPGKFAMKLPGGNERQHSSVRTVVLIAFEQILIGTCPVSRLSLSRLVHPEEVVPGQGFTVRWTRFPFSPPEEGSGKQRPPDDAHVKHVTQLRALT